MLLIVWDRKTTEEVLAAGRRPDMTGDKHLIVDSLVEIKPTGRTTGEVVWEWHLWDHLIQDFDMTKPNYGSVAQHPELVNLNFGEDDLPPPPTDPKEKRPVRAQPDWTHFNGVAYNPDLDQIAVSVHSFSEFWIIDHSTTTAEAAGHTGGRSGKGGDLLYRWGNPRAYRAGSSADRMLFNQHNAHWIPKGLPGEGHILVFNNGGERPEGSFSSVDELILPVDSQGRYTCTPGTAYGPGQPVWSYSAPKKPDFFSHFISGAQRLPNGNTLICSGANGTAFEVTPEKEIVWKYINPIKGGPGINAPRQPGRIVSTIAADLLALSPEQRLRCDELQKEVDAHLDKLLMADQKKQLNQTPQGPGSGGGPSPQPGKIMSGTEKGQLKLTDDQRKDLDAFQKTVDEKFDKVLNEAQRRQLKSVFGPQGPGPGGPGGPQLPGMFLSASQKDALKLTAEQKKQFDEMQKAIDGKMDKLLTEAQKKQLEELKQAARRDGIKGSGRSPPPGGAPMFRANRYATSHPAFSGRDMTPGKTIEELQQEQAKKKVEFPL